MLGILGNALYGINEAIVFELEWMSLELRSGMNGCCLFFKKMFVNSSSDCKSRKSYRGKQLVGKYISWHQWDNDLELDLLPFAFNWIVEWNLQFFCIHGNVGSAGCHMEKNFLWETCYVGSVRLLQWLGSWKKKIIFGTE